jgi:hypothetical protein
VLSKKTKKGKRKSTVNIVIYKEVLKTFPLKQEAGQWCPVSTLLFNIVFELLGREIGGKKSFN